MTKEEIAEKYSLGFALWYCKYNPDYEAESPSRIDDLYEAWLAGHHSPSR
jgi:hypothetical protein